VIIRRAAGVTVLATTLAACSGGSSSKPGTLPSLNTPTATVAPTSAAVTVPPAAQAHTRVGAAEFVRFFFTELDKAYQAGTPFPLDGLADPACETCRLFASTASDNAARSERFASPTFVEITSEAPPIEKGYVYVDFSAKTPTRVLLDSAGNIVARYKQSGPQIHLTVVAMLIQGLGKVDLSVM
jgi:hypothetical protein